MDVPAAPAQNRASRFAVSACAALVVLGLSANRGYFSHDELQWLAFADTDGWPHVPWTDFSAIDTFQYRPVTFKLWLALMHVLGYRPMAMHAAIAGIGLANALLLRACALRLGATRTGAGAAMLVFLLFPYAMYVHGWVGTIADLLVCACTLLALLWLLRGRNAHAAAAAYGTPGDAVVVATLTLLALLCKESAVVFPALLLCAWPLRRRRLALPIAASSAVVLAYLLLRAKTILFTPHEAGVYTWSVGNVPGNAALFALFPFDLGSFEILGSRGLRGLPLYAALACIALVLAAVASAGWRRAGALLAGCLACLGPTLILDSVSNVYGYLAAAFACGAVAVAAPRMKPAARWLLVVPVAVVAIHGLAVDKRMLHIGSMQHHLYADLVRLLPDADAEHPLRIRALREADDATLRRLLYGIPSYRRIPLATRATAVSYRDATPAATHWMTPSGRLVPASVATHADARSDD